MEIKISFGDLKTSPPELMKELIARVWGVHSHNNEHHFVGSTFPASEWPIVVNVIRNHIKPK